MAVLFNNDTSLLDRIRISNGVERLRISFANMFKHNEQEAVSQLNDKNLRYCSLYALKPLIKRFNLYDNLSLINQRALEITEKIKTRNYSDIEKMASEDMISNYTVLKWIFDTGRLDDGINNQYDEILDMTGILLIKLFNDNSILDSIAEMIFNRNRRGRYFDDLLWAFLESKKSAGLSVIAERIRSVHPEDTALARSILSFIPANKRSDDRESEYSDCIKWLQENYRFMKSTGESFQQFRNPVPYAVSLEAKYLCKAIDSCVQNDLNAEAGDEQNLLGRFRELEKNVQQLLADYSFRLFRNDSNRWKEWINKPVEEQIEIAKNLHGGLN